MPDRRASHERREKIRSSGLDRADLEAFASGSREAGSRPPRHVAVDPDSLEQGLAKLVLTLIELLRQLLERQAMRRVEGGTLSEEEIERLGQTFIKLEERMTELKQAFGLQDEDLRLDLASLWDSPS